MTDTSSPQEAAQAPPTGTTVAWTPMGQRMYLIPCTTCGATIPTGEFQWTDGYPGPHIRAHSQWHADRGEPRP